MSGLGNLIRKVGESAASKAAAANKNGTTATDKDGVALTINRPAIRGLLEDMTLETVAKQLNARFSDSITGRTQEDADPMEGLVDIEDVMDVDKSAGLPHKKQQNP